MDNHFNTKAFIIKYYSFGSSHKVIILFSKNLGKIKIILYGALKNPSKGAVFELLNEVQLNLLKSSKSDFYQLIDFNPIKNLYSIYSKLSFEFMNNLYFIGEFLDQFIQEEDVHEDIFESLEKLIAQIINDLPFFKIYFLSFRFISLEKLGFLPHLQKKCFHCNLNFITTQSIYIHYQKFQIYCKLCQKKYITLNDLSIIKINFETLKLFLSLNDVNVNSYSYDFKTAILKKELEFENILKKFEKNILGKDIS